MKRRKTLRQMQPVARKLARLLNELESVKRRLDNAIPELQAIELEARALQQMAQRLGDAELLNDQMREALKGRRPFCTLCGGIDHERIDCHSQPFSEGA